MDRLENFLPLWAHDSWQWLVLLVNIAGIVLFAWLLRYVLRKIIKRMIEQQRLALDVAVPIKTLGGWLIVLGASIWILETLGVSGQILWTAMTGFAAVAAVAFFAAWSVLSNIFCALLIFTTRPFRVGDELEILDAADKIGIRGRVMTIHLLYTSLQELGRDDGRYTLVQIPNSAFFQKTIRRWHGSDGEPRLTQSR